jgi:RNA polymerase sigma-70 factor (ECF subfamily)
MDDQQGNPSLALSDEELAARASLGSLPGFEELVRRYQVPLMRFLLWRGCGRQDAEDLVQEAFLRAYQSLHHYNRARRFKTWMYTICYRQAISHRRRNPAIVLAAGGQETIADGREGPLPQLERQEARGRLWDLARRVLTEAQFTAVWLYYVDGLAAGEVARVMDRSWPWVKTTLHRARRKLQAELDQPAQAAVIV